MSPAEKCSCRDSPGQGRRDRCQAAILQVIVDGWTAKRSWSAMLIFFTASFSIIPPFRAGLLFLQKLFGLFFQDAVIFQAVEGLKVFQGNFGQFSITSVGGPP